MIQSNEELSSLCFSFMSVPSLMPKDFIPLLDIICRSFELTLPQFELSASM